MRIWTFVMLGAIFAQVAQAVPPAYTGAIADGSWEHVDSVFECRLNLPLPLLGDAVFRTRAGERSAFYLTTRAATLPAGNAVWQSRNPVWRPRAEAQMIAAVGVKYGKRPLWVNTQLAEQLVAELNAGREIALTTETSDNPLLVLSNLGFRKAYHHYLACLPELLPANFDQLKRSALMFDATKGEQPEALTSRASTKLDQILKLVKHDKRVRRFFIDGHTSSMGDRADNLAVSKERAELVADYLRRRGVPDKWMTIRWHGERYPVASNGSAAGRAKNRRVTVRLERVEEIEVLPLASR